MNKQFESSLEKESREARKCFSQAKRSEKIRKQTRAGRLLKAAILTKGEAKKFRKTKIKITKTENGTDIGNGNGSRNGRDSELKTELQTKD